MTTSSDSEKTSPAPIARKWVNSDYLCEEKEFVYPFKEIKAVEVVTYADHCREIAALRERCATIAEEPDMIDRVGGSTGNAFGTAKRIAAAIRQEAT
jgi:hypothetical protein